MSYLQIKNRAISSLAADINSTATSLTVQTGDGAKFPQPGNGFNITIEDEILKCTARSTDTLTVVRAQEGTTAAGHVAGKAVELRITAGVITNVEDELDAHAALTSPHSAVSTATASRLVVRDASARAAFAAPGAAGDALIKGTRVTISELPTLTTDKIWKGVGGVPAEASLPVGPTVVRKTADEIVNNSVSLQNDDHLFFSIGANEVWLVEFTLMGQGAWVAGIKFGFAYPTGCFMHWGTIGLLEFATNNYDYGQWITQSTFGNAAGIKELASETGTMAVGLKSATTVTGIILRAIIINGANAGSVNLQWAQNTATAEDTKLLAGSSLVAFKLS